MRIDQDDPGQASFLNTPIRKLGSDELKLRDVVYEVPTEIHEALFLTGCGGNRMKKQKVIETLTFDNFLSDIGHRGERKRAHA